MKNSYKLALLAALGLASVTAAQAQNYYNDGSGNNANGDLIVGLYQPGSVNTSVINLGGFSSLYDGESWTLNTLGLASAGFGSTLSASTVFGVVGDYLNPGAGADAVYATTAGAAPGNINGSGAWGSYDGGLSNVQLGTAATGSSSDWNTQNNPQSSGTMAAAFGYSPNVSVTGVANFWTILDDNSAPTLDGTFTLNPTTEVLTFNVAPVPEPTTCALLGGAGLLLLSFRKKLGRK